MAAGRLRTIVVLVASALVAGLAAPGVAQGEVASPAGTGSSDGSTSVLQLALGSDALALRLLGEDSLTSNDTGAGGPRAVERLSPLQLASTLLPALDTLDLPTVETSATSGEDTRTTDPVDLGALTASGPVPGLVSGTIDPVALRSFVDASGATSTASGAAQDLSVLGGLFSVGTASADLGSNALVTDAGALRGLQLDSLEVVDLGALLNVLGLSLSDLPVDVAVGLLDQLGLPLPGGVTPEALLATLDGLLTQTSAVRAQVTDLQAQIDDLQSQISSLTSQLAAATAQVDALTAQLAAQQALLAGCGGVPLVCAPIQALIDSLTAQLAAAQASVATIDAAIDALQVQVDALVAQIDALLATVAAAVDELVGLVDGILDGLGAAPLLSVDDLVVGVTAKADDTLATSAASVVGSVGDVRLGTQSLGGLDAGAVLSQVIGLSDQLTGLLGDVLGSIDPSLAGLVELHLLERTTSVTESGGVTHAVAGLTGLRATVTPPDLCGVLDRLAPQDTLGSLLTGLGAQLPALGPVGDVLGDLGSTVTCSSGGAEAASVLGAVTQPLEVRALSVSGTGSFSVPAAPATPASTPGTLPATGGPPGLAVLALALGLAAYGTRRLLARAV